jgi:hypothetical protein
MSFTEKVPKTTFSLIRYLYKNWDIFLAILIIIPTVISSVSYAIKTSNPTYPVFQLAGSLFIADAQIQKDVNTLQTNPEELTGIKPEYGIWKTVVYYWKYFFNVIWKFFSNVYLIFFPFFIIKKLVSYTDTGKDLRNFLVSFFIFIFYLFLANLVILIHSVIIGNSFITFPENSTIWYQYYIIFLNALPFHGLISLVKYVIISLLA